VLKALLVSTVAPLGTLPKITSRTKNLMPSVSPQSTQEKNPKPLSPQQTNSLKLNASKHGKKIFLRMASERLKTSSMLFGSQKIYNVLLKESE
jgi:hypothetical protein